MLNQYLDIAAPVKEALKNNQAVVALESTIISHGMPYPQNVETALAVESIVRKNGAVPATIAIIDGQLKAGLNQGEIDYLGKEGQKITKTSRRDLPFIIAKKMSGATTVASTMIIANLAGIRFFATGGIGGVHKGAENSMDISADLQELANTNVAVICAGIKSILDLARTLEYLETHGVPIIGYQTKELPAFYTRSSGHEIDYQVDSATEIATALKAKWDLNLQGGVVIANPIPEVHQMEPTYINGIISKAIELSEQAGIKGKDSTPYLLAKIEELTKGESLKSNIQLLVKSHSP